MIGIAHIIVILLILAFLLSSIITFISRGSEEYANSITERLTNLNAKYKPKFLFWTGGYDSTFHLCQCIKHSSDKLIQPIYLLNCDGLIGGGRKNAAYEIGVMNNIVSEIGNNRILPLIIVDCSKMPLSASIITEMSRLTALGRVSRPISQYSYMAEISQRCNLPMDECVEKSSHSIMGKLVENYVILITDESIPVLHNYKLPHDIYSIFKNLRFPIIRLTKDDMLEMAKKDGYDHILHQTISCWFPKDGKPCGNCNMCKERIV